MRVVRPFPKELLKKMFLKVLYESDKTEITSCDSNFISIICTILTEQFDVSELNEHEFNEIVTAVNELEADGLVIKDENKNSSKIKVLTAIGREYVENRLENFMLPAVEIENFLTRDDLKRCSLEDYLNGDYETAILKAFSLIEDVTRSRMIKPSRFVESGELSQAYISKEGLFKEKDDEIILSLESIQRIMLGTIYWFGNPSDGKRKIFNNSQAAAQVLLFANLHLNLISEEGYNKAVVPSFEP